MGLAGLNIFFISVFETSTYSFMKKRHRDIEVPVEVEDGLIFLKFRPKIISVNFLACMATWPSSDDTIHLTYDG
jgi:hypothetical protein